MLTLNTALTIAMVLTVVGLVCACIRLIIGPSRSDRVVSLDLITILLVAISAQLAMLYEAAAYLDLGLAIGLIGFLATVAFARYIELAPQRKTADESASSEAQRQGIDSGHPHKPTESETQK